MCSKTLKQEEEPSVVSTVILDIAKKKKTKKNKFKKKTYQYLNKSLKNKKRI